MTAQAFTERSIIQGGPPLEVTLIDGTRVPYRLSMDSLAALEDSFGSITAMQDQVREANDRLGNGGSAVAEGKIKMMRTVIDMIAMGVRHVPWEDPVTGERVRLGARRELVGELLDPARLQEYMNTVGVALQQAFGAFGQEGSGGPQVPATPTPAPSVQVENFPGHAGGTSQPSSAAAPMPPFGT